METDFPLQWIFQLVCLLFATVKIAIDLLQTIILTKGESYASDT